MRYKKKIKKEIFEYIDKAEAEAETLSLILEKLKGRDIIEVSKPRTCGACEHYTNGICHEIQETVSKDIIRDCVWFKR